MKRFYCVKCQKMKRTQKWPLIIHSKDSIIPTERIGECNYHRIKAVESWTGKTRAGSIRAKVGA